MKYPKITQKAITDKDLRLKILCSQPALQTGDTKEIIGEIQEVIMVIEEVEDHIEFK